MYNSEGSTNSISVIISNEDKDNDKDASDSKECNVDLDLKSLDLKLVTAKYWFWLQDSKTDSSVYIAALLLLVLCGLIISIKIYLTREEEDLTSSTFKPLSRKVESNFK